MPALLGLLLPALIPAGVDIAKGLFGAVTRLITGDTGAKPQNIDEAIKLMAAETERIRALKELDEPAPNISKWVADLRASFRYIGAGMIILAGGFVIVFDAVSPAIGLPAIPQETYDIVTQLMGSVFAFMFGDRVNMAIRRAK